ncbi:hypothetical protein L6452_12038 [Arctium lappa]|uniref:Uncharacterized protein n=1 Tax=Arctium lappa TaxID=4217 RepID=A0ACB9DQB7_ARCLA|nr:hypothetical protein L6452_12038 [Arctium lappa]
MSFHMIKQMARASAQKNGSTMSRTSERMKAERSKKRPRLGSGGISQSSRSNRVQISEFSESLEEFGVKLGLSWEAINNGGQAQKGGGKYGRVWGEDDSLCRTQRFGADTGVSGDDILFSGKEKPKFFSNFLPVTRIFLKNPNPGKTELKPEQNSLFLPLRSNSHNQSTLFLGICWIHGRRLSI